MSHTALRRIAMLRPHKTTRFVLCLLILVCRGSAASYFDHKLTDQHTN